MSNYIVKPESIAKISNFIANVKYNTWSLDIPESLKNTLTYSFGIHSLDEKKICRYLAHFNYMAVDDRYNKMTDAEKIIAYQDECVKALDDNYIYAPTWEDGRRKLTADHIQLYKTLQCFLYQVDSDITCNTELYKGLNDLVNIMARWIVANTIEYKNANWE